MVKYKIKCPECGLYKSNDQFKWATRKCRDCRGGFDDSTYVYVILTTRNTLYTGITKDVEHRYQQHLSGKGAKYTRANKPKKLLYSYKFSTRQEACAEEYKIKQMTREQKLKYIKGGQK